MQSTALPEFQQRWALIAGTRPEAIKMSPVYFAAKSRTHVTPLLVASGQHHEPLATAFASFRITPDHVLPSLPAGQSLAQQMANLIDRIGESLARLQPDAVLVQGDTSTALCGALAAFGQQIPVYHIEAGLRSGRLDAPFPEEANRSMIARLARLHFAPTAHAAKQLHGEGISPAAIHVTGNTVIDALNWIRRQPLTQPMPVAIPSLPYLLVTAHRRENFGGGIVQLSHALQALAKKLPTTPILFPVHHNPQVRGPVESLLAGYPTIQLLTPLAYPHFVQLLEQAHGVLTDSGGVQEEAAALGKPLIISRTVTERIEAVRQETALLAGTNVTTIVKHIHRLFTDADFYRRMAQPVTAYGDGHAAARIVDLVATDLSGMRMREWSA